MYKYYKWNSTTTLIIDISPLFMGYLYNPPVLYAKPYRRRSVIIPRCVLRIKSQLDQDWSDRMFPASRCRIASFSFFPFLHVDGIVLSQISYEEVALTIPRSRTQARPVFTHSSFLFLHGLSAWSTRKLGGRRDHIIRKYMYAVTWLFRRSPQISRQPAENMGLTMVNDSGFICIFHARLMHSLTFSQLLHLCWFFRASFFSLVISELISQ